MSSAFFLIKYLIMRNSLAEQFDFLFIGLGAANCLLLLNMHDHNLLHDKKIAVIEPDHKNVNDRTFCFWTSEEELSTFKLEKLVSSKWRQIQVAGREHQSIRPLNYNHIRGIDLYTKVKELLKEQEAKFYTQIFTSEPIIEAESFKINLPQSTIIAAKVFDSRPPSYQEPEKNQSHLFQSFYGWQVKAENYTFDTATMVMMDFDIPQNDYCQFMYILPFTADTALFEVTRFGKEKITREESEILLKDYIRKFGFSYQIEEEEKGVIPMSSLQLAHSSYGINWINTGANANMVKPTTGYAFHNMAIDAQHHVEAMQNEQPYVRKKNAGRFKFYDRLLLKILEETPQHGKRVFQDLFNRVPLKKVLPFLNEKSSLLDEIYIFSKLPILLFLRVAIKDVLHRFVKTSPAIIAFVFTLLALVLSTLKLEITLWVALGTGFLSIGLSHGAVDYLTGKAIEGWRHLIKFIASYLLKGALLGLLWIILPDLALLAFIAFSAWHFGQADFKEWKLSQGFNSFMWGFTVLLLILFYHIDETIAVLQQVRGLQLPFILKELTVDQLFLGKLIIALFSLFITVLHKSKHMLLTVSYLLLSSLLPLLISFGIFFVFQHSLHGWNHLRSDLKLTSYKLWLKSLPFSSGGALLILLFMLGNTKDYIGVFFILLSCISMPHILSMNYFYTRRFQA
jgi:lycopene beta-cyclase